MKHLIGVFFVFALSACAVKAGGDVPPPSADTSFMQLKGASGYRQVSVNDVVALDVKVRESNLPSSAIIARHFEGAGAGNALRDFGLNAPSEPGYPAAMATGEVTFRLKTGEIRNFYILN